jgi:hypothetical protein
MTESQEGFDRIGWECLRQTHLPPSLPVPIILVPSHIGLPAGTRNVEGVISGG